MTSGGSLGSQRGTRVVLELPRTGGPVTVTVQDPYDVTRKAFAVVQVQAPVEVGETWPTHRIAAGDGWSAASTPDGSLWMWGRNDAGQIPGADAKRVPIPLRIEGLQNIQTVESHKEKASGIFIMAVDREGTVWGWGRERNPRELASEISKVSLDGCPIYLDKSGKLFFGEEKKPWYADSVAYLNMVAGVNTSLTKQVIGLTRDGKVLAGDACGTKISAFPGIANVKQVVGVAPNAFLAMTQDGKTYVLDTAENKIRQVSGFAGVRRIYAFPSTPLSTRDGWGFALKENGDVLSFLTNRAGAATPPKILGGLNNIVDISVSRTHALFLREDGVVFAMGNNAHGQLGNGGPSDALTKPVQVAGLNLGAR